MGPLLTLLFAGFFILSAPSPAFSQAADRLTSRSELLALYSLRSTLGLRAGDWPRGSDPCLVWTGVTCQSGRVVGLDIAGLKRTRLGRLNPRFDVTGLQELRKLNRFNASGFLLPGSIPDWFGARLPPNFSVLDLRGSGVTGEIPKSLGNLSSLTILDLSLNQLKGHIPASVGNLTAAKTLNLSHNGLSGSIPDPFWSLPGLSELDLSGNQLTGELPVLPPSIGLISNRVVILSNNLYYGKISQNFATFFSHLDLSGNYFDGPIPIRNNSISASMNCFLNATDQRAPSDCISFYSSRGLPYDGPTSPPAQHHSKKKRHVKYILIAAIAGGALLLVLALTTVLYCLCFRSSRQLRRQTPDPDQQQQQQPNSRPNIQIRETIPTAARAEADGARSHSMDSFTSDGGTHFAAMGVRGGPNYSSVVVTVGESYSYDHLLEATAGFSDENLIHRGHTGDFYEGRLGDGTRVAVKRMGPTVVKRAAYVAAELDLFAKGMMNRRLVQFMGHCLGDKNDMFMVYRMVKYGDLVTVFHRKPCIEEGDGQEEVQSIDWITRLKIATGVAQALCYLHFDCDPPIVHRDVQASSILLDDKFEVRLTSLSESCVEEAESTPNVITRLLKFSSSNLEASTSSSRSQSAALHDDVYNLGLVLLELISGQSPGATSDWLSRVVSCIDNDNKELITQVVDPFLTIDEDHLEEVWGVALLAKACLNSKPNKRPNIRHVIRALENPLKLAREDSLRKLRATSARGSWNTHFWGDSNGGSRRSEVAPEP